MTSRIIPVPQLVFGREVIERVDSTGNTIEILYDGPIRQKEE